MHAFSKRSLYNECYLFCDDYAIICIAIVIAAIVVHIVIEIIVILYVKSVIIIIIGGDTAGTYDAVAVAAIWDVIVVGIIGRDH